LDRVALIIVCRWFVAAFELVSSCGLANECLLVSSYIESMGSSRIEVKEMCFSFNRGRAFAKAKGATQEALLGSYCRLLAPHEVTKFPPNGMW
jgi:hypothetical protein